MRNVGLAGDISTARTPVLLAHPAIVPVDIDEKLLSILDCGLSKFGSPVGLRGNEILVLAQVFEKQMSV